MGRLKPAYNLQIGVNSEYIVGLDLFPNPTDVRLGVAQQSFHNFNYQDKHLLRDKDLQQWEIPQKKRKNIIKTVKNVIKQNNLILKHIRD